MASRFLSVFTAVLLTTERAAAGEGMDTVFTSDASCASANGQPALRGEYTRVSEIRPSRIATRNQDASNGGKRRPVVRLCAASTACYPGPAAAGIKRAILGDAPPVSYALH